MRLLRTDTDELKLVTFNDEQKLPSYAILSHTWMTDDDEVSFGDLADVDTVEIKAGRKKIELAKREARAGGLSYLWVDTCCIDKSSSTELAESINSMFRWYRKAQVCYVYLEDMPENTALWNDQPPCMVSEKTSFSGPVREMCSCSACSSYAILRRCKWFTRGWTLQELLAPCYVQFFASSWGNPIGTLDRTHLMHSGGADIPGAKSTLFSRAIASITGIYEAALISETPFEHYSVAQRMSWAASRNTTRVEDLAYCLLGIFDVNMPILYGEGGKAFERLQLEIIRSSSDQTIFAWNSEARRAQDHASLLAPYVHCFADLDDVVRIPSMERDGHEVTTKGVRLCLPIVKLMLKPGTVQILCGILACRRQNDHARAIALNLGRTSSDSQPASYDAHFYVRGLILLDPYTIEPETATQLLLRMQQPPVALPQHAAKRAGDLERLVLRCMGPGIAQNVVTISSVLPEDLWNHDRRALQFRLEPPFVDAGATDVPWVPAATHYPSNVMTIFGHPETGHDTQLSLHESASSYVVAPNSSAYSTGRKSADAYVRAEVRLTCEGKPCATILMSSTAYELDWYESPDPQIIPLYDFKIVTSEHELRSAESTKLQELKLDGPSLCRRALVAAGLIISLDARRVMFLDQAVVFVEIKAMRIARSRDSFQGTASALHGIETERFGLLVHRKPLPLRHQCATCSFASKGAADLRRHQAQFHGPQRRYVCNAYGCAAIRSREDKMKEHCYSQHGQRRADADYKSVEDPPKAEPAGPSKFDKPRSQFLQGAQQNTSQD